MDYWAITADCTYNDAGTSFTDFVFNSSGRIYSPLGTFALLTDNVASASKVVNYIPHASTTASSTQNTFYTDYGYIALGPMNNGGSAHIYTGQTNFYFNKELMVNGNTVYHSANLPATTLLAALGNYVWSAASLPQSFPEGIQSSFVSGTEGFPNYGSLMTMRTYSGGGGSLQMYVPYGPNNGGNTLQVRFGNYDVTSGNSWTGWKSLWHDGNFNPAGYSTTGHTHDYAVHRGEGANFIDYAYGLYDAYQGGWRTSNDLRVLYAITAGSTARFTIPDGSRQANDKLPNDGGGFGMRGDFVTCGSVGTSGGFAGLFTIIPYTGTTASGGDASYQLVFGGTAYNGGGVPWLRIRKGIDSTWNSFYDIPIASGLTATKVPYWDGEKLLDSSINYSAATGNIAFGGAPVAFARVYLQSASTVALYSQNTSVSGDAYGLEGLAYGVGGNKHFGGYYGAAGATYNYAIYIPVNYPPAGANNYAIYSQSVAQSYFSGSVIASGGGFNSLRSIKNIHKDWGGSALNVISKFKIRDFNYKTRPDYDRTLGFIIDEIPKEISEYALSGEERNAVNTYTLHGLSFKGLQEVKTKLDVQSGELDWQSAKIILLEKKILELEGRLNQ